MSDINYEEYVKEVYPDAQAILVDYSDANLWCITTPKRMLSHHIKTKEIAWQSAYQFLLQQDKIKQP